MANTPREDCIEQVAKATGKKRDEIEDLLADIDERADNYQRDGMNAGEAYQRARDETLNDINERAALRRRAEILDMRKFASLSRYFDDTLKAIKLLPLSDARRAKLARQAASLALEAKLVGVNLPLFKGRLSVDAQYVALRRLWVGGLARDLEEAGLLKIFASRALEQNWTRELFELNRGRDGNPGLTKDKQALQIAQVIRKWQREGMAGINREGGWVRSYSGFITRTSHDPDHIRRAGPVQWASDLLPLLDLKKTFGTADRERVLNALYAMHSAFVRGDHFDYGKPLQEELYPSVAARASASRELHFKDGKSWLAYNRKYGTTDPTETVVNSLSLSARRVALMKEFGTRPREAFEQLVKTTKAKLQAEAGGYASKLAALKGRLDSPGADAAARAKVEEEIGSLSGSLGEATDRFEDFKRFTGEGRTMGWLGSPADNRFAQIDGSAAKPVNRTNAQVLAGWMAVQRMAKLGRVLFTHISSLPTKTAEARYWGIPVAERYGSLLRGITSGLKGSAKRQAVDATLIGLESRLGHMMSRYDVADAPHGYLAKWESLFFKLTGVSSVTDNQRADAEAMFAGHVGAKRGLDWDAVGRKEQRVLQGFGIGKPEWEALHGVEWSKIGDRTYLFPSDALKLSDDQVRAYLEAANPGGAGFSGLNRAGDIDVAKAREDLALQLAAAYTDRASFAVPMPSARVRAMMFQNAFAPGTPLNSALRVIYQFKLWAADMILRTWGREIYGTIGDGRMDRVAGLTEFLVGSVIFGTGGEALRSLVQGKDPIAELRNNPFGTLARGAQRSGFGSLIGDFLLGEYDRHGFTALDQLAGPTFSQIDNVIDMLWAGDTGRRHGVLSPQAWRARGSDAIRLARNNTPFMNLWSTSLAMNTLVWHRLQEWINPGYLRRSERRQQAQSGTEFWLSPSKADQWVTGQGASPF